jgi:FkbM family methyltransferase
MTRLPRFRGKGRIVLAIDSLLTDGNDPRSYIDVGRVNGCPFQFDLRPWGQKFAFYYGEWESDLIRTLSGFYRGGTFVDVGSSLGLYVAALGPLVREQGGALLSIEPVPQNLERQRINIRLNGLEDIVELLPVAVGDRAGTLRIKSDRVGGDNNAFFSEEGDIVVPLRTLDDIMDERRALPPVTVIKMDVEGYEPLVIAGAHRLIERDRPVILSEFCRERMVINELSMNETWRQFKSWRYRGFRLDGRHLVEFNEPAAFENVFLIPEEKSATLMGLRAH